MNLEMLLIIFDIPIITALVIVFMCKHIITFRRLFITILFHIIAIAIIAVFEKITPINDVLSALFTHYETTPLGRCITQIILKLFIATCTLLQFILCKKLKLITTTMIDCVWLSILSGASFPIVVFIVVFGVLGAH